MIRKIYKVFKTYLPFCKLKKPQKVLLSVAKNKIATLLIEMSYFPGTYDT